MEIKRDIVLSFDDVLLEPQYSEILSRKNVDISSIMGFTEKSKIELKN